MGFGLHVGWSIEGPIGSEVKIDVSYFGSNVNMSSRLESATKCYGVSILISGELYDLMTYKNKDYLRQVDEVWINKKSMRLYTVDLSPEHLLKRVGVHHFAGKSLF